MKESDCEAGRLFSLELSALAALKMSEGLSIEAIAAAYSTTTAKILGIFPKEESDRLLKALQFTAGLSRDILKNPNPDTVADCHEAIDDYKKNMKPTR